MLSAPLMVCTGPSVWKPPGLFPAGSRGSFPACADIFLMSKKRAKEWGAGEKNIFARVLS
jgi:hypothetical protein